MDYRFQPRGVCSQEIQLSLDENGVITACRFIGGCSGNTQGVSRLVTGMKAGDAIAKLEGIRCGPRPTSCPDQLSKALKLALAEK
ncbi:MAG: TIGR03905 family TSCPD domain-containing protein [Ruminococcaceae bacterium]|nr:TIGR03905 family TSCPD domain-containing protein [Oscillospiraceae bacterium]